MTMRLLGFNVTSNLEFTSPVSTGVVVGESTALTCTVTKFDKTPVVEWFKKGTDADASKGTGTNL